MKLPANTKKSQFPLRSWKEVVVKWREKSGEQLQPNTAKACCMSALKKAREKAVEIGLDGVHVDTLIAALMAIE